MEMIWFANDTELTKTPSGWSVEASDLGFHPGTWPHQLVVNGHSYKLEALTEEAGLYRQTAGGDALLKVWND